MVHCNDHVAQITQCELFKQMSIDSENHDVDICTNLRQILMQFCSKVGLRFIEILSAARPLFVQLSRSSSKSIWEVSRRAGRNVHSEYLSIERIHSGSSFASDWGAFWGIFWINWQEVKKLWARYIKVWKKSLLEAPFFALLYPELKAF